MRFIVVVSKHGMVHWVLLSVYLVGGNAPYICQDISSAFNFTGSRLVTRLNCCSWKHQDTEGDRPFESKNLIFFWGLTRKWKVRGTMQWIGWDCASCALRVRVPVTHGEPNQHGNMSISELCESRKDGQRPMGTSLQPWILFAVSSS